MDLPKKTHYGVTCKECTLTLWFSSQTQAELALEVSYPDLNLPMVNSPMGLAIGFGRFDHYCNSNNQNVKTASRK